MSAIDCWLDTFLVPHHFFFMYRMTMPIRYASAGKSCRHALNATKPSFLGSKNPNSVLCWH